MAKSRLGEPFHRPERPDREEKIYQRRVRTNGGPLDDGAIWRLFERILHEARCLERVTHICDEI
jgi:chorismate mutase